MPPKAITIGNVTGSSQTAGAPSCAPHSPTETMATMWSSPDIGCWNPLTKPPSASPNRCAKAVAGHRSKRQSRAALRNRAFISPFPAIWRSVGWSEPAVAISDNIAKRSAARKFGTSFSFVSAAGTRNLGALFRRAFKETSLALPPQKICIFVVTLVAVVPEVKDYFGTVVK
jgi:hypothetical protein